MTQTHGINHDACWHCGQHASDWRLIPGELGYGWEVYCSDCGAQQGIVAVESDVPAHGSA